MIIKKILVLALVLQSITLSEVYNDRLRIYIDNSVHDFSVDEKIGLSNNIELNRMMEKSGATKIRQWLPNARPTDRDGDIYLNRYNIVFFEESKKISASLFLFNTK